MAVSGELAKYIGNEIIKVGGKDLATKTATSALSSLAPKVATKVGTGMATKAGTSLLNQATALGLAKNDANKWILNTGILDTDEGVGKIKEFMNPILGGDKTPNYQRFLEQIGEGEYQMGHRPNLYVGDSETKFPLSNMEADPDYLPKIYGDNEASTIRNLLMLGNTSPDAQRSAKIIAQYQNQPDKMVKIFRQAPKDMNYGDWVGLTKEYADYHIGNNPNNQLWEREVPANEVMFAGDDINEWGYYPKQVQLDDEIANELNMAIERAGVGADTVSRAQHFIPKHNIPVEESSYLSSIIPVKRKLYRGQQYSNTDFSYNSELMNENPDKWGSKDVGKGYHFTPKKDMAGSWEGSDGGVIEVDYTPDQVLKADDARKMIEEANKLLADDKYMAKLWQENEAMAEQIEKIADGNLEALAKREGKPFVQHLKANDDELGTMYYYKDIDPELTDRFVSEFKQKAEKYMPKRASANGDDMVTLFHNTKAENIPSIMEQGLIPGKRPGGYLASPEEAGIWTDDRGLKSGSYGGTTVKIRVPKKEFDATRVNDTQNLLNRVIKPSEIEGVDYMLFDTPLIKNSNLQEYIDKYGEDKVRELIEKKGLVSPEVIDKSFNDLKSDMSLSATDIKQPAGYSNLINKAKGYKSLDRFEKMNNPIKGSEIWGEKPTSAFQRDSRAVRINMFPNEAVKGTGITKQYLLNLLKDAYDQGITRIVPSYGSYTKEGASFMDHLAEQGWVKATGKNGWSSYEIAPKIAEWEKTDPLADIYNEAHNTPDARM